MRQSNHTKRIFLSAMLACSVLLVTACRQKDKNAVNDETVKEEKENTVSQENPDDVVLDFSKAFFCPYNQTYLERLKTEYQLDDLVKGCETQLDQVKAVTAWVTGLWEHDGDNQPKQSDPLYILDSVTKDGQQYRCVEYGSVIDGCLNALSFTSRTIALKTEDVETREYGAGHVGTEVYLPDYQKWVFVDGQWGAIPMKNDIPLNAYEFGQAIRNHDAELSILWAAEDTTNHMSQNYYDWIEEYLYYLDYTYYESIDEGADYDEIYTSCKGTHVMYVPEGARQVTIFQRVYDLNVDIYTSNVDSFYSIPGEK